MRLPTDRLAGLLILLLVPGAAAAGVQLQDVKGSKDHPVVSRYAGSTVIGYQIRDFDEFVLPLGPVQRVEGAGIVVEPTKSQRLEGRHTRILYVAPADRSPLEVLRNYEGELAKAGFQTLYSCAGAACGGEDGWLGEHFLVLLDVIEVQPMDTGMVTVDAAAMAKDIAATGRVALYGIHFDTDKADIKPESAPTVNEIAALLTADPALKLYVVGHTDDVGGFDYNTQLSQRRAASVVRALTAEHGIAAARLQPAGVGLLAPVAPNDTEEGRAKNRRVELVEQ